MDKIGLILVWVLMSPVYALPGESLVPYTTYAHWTSVKKRTYIHEVRDAVLEYEQAAAASGRYDFAARVTGFMDDPVALLNWVNPLAPAWADGGQCLIGGVERPLIRVKKRWLCPTLGRECGSFSGQDRGFTCGSVYAGVCVSIQPIETLSQRCHDSGTVMPDQATYTKMSKVYDAVVAHCKVMEKRFAGPCDDFTKRVADIHSQYTADPTKPNPPAEAAKPTPPEGAGPTMVQAPPLGAGQPIAAPPEAPDAATPAVPANPTTPSPEVGAADCKAAYGMVIEGHDTNEGRVDEDFHRVAKRLADSFAQVTGGGVSVIPPPGALTQFYGHSDAEIQSVNAAFNAIEDKNKICESPAPAALADYALGIHEAPRAPRANEDLDWYSHDPKVNAERMTDLPASGIANTKLMDKVNKLKAKCGDKADQVVMISLIDHGGESPCEVALTNNKKISPQDVAEKIIKPLANQGVHVIFTADACFSGCFVEALKKQKFGAPVCIMSETRASTVGYGSDPIIKGTYDVTYPNYLAKLKNPLKAHICASIWDPMNEPQIATSQDTPAQAKSSIDARGASLAEKRVNSLKDLGQKLGLGDNLEQDCAPLNDPSANGAFSEERIKKVFACKEFHDVLQNALKPFGEDAANKFLDTVVDPNNAPGLQAVLKTASDPYLDATKGGCNVNLADYPQNPPSSAEAPPVKSDGVTK